MMTTTVSVYAPTLYSLDEEKETLNAMLNTVLSNIPKEVKILVVRDFNAS